MKKLIIALIILVIAVGGVFSYRQLAQEKIPKEENQALDETADWKVYKNNKYGYEVRYPDNMFIYDALSNYDSPADQNTKIVSFDDVFVYPFFLIESKLRFHRIYLYDVPRNKLQ